MSTITALDEHLKDLFLDVRDYLTYLPAQVPNGIRAEIPCVSVIELFELLAKSYMGESLSGLTNMGISLGAGGAGAIGFVIPELHGENARKNKGKTFYLHSAEKYGIDYYVKSVPRHIIESFMACGYGTLDMLRGGSSKRDFAEHSRLALFGESFAYLPAAYLVHYFLEKSQWELALLGLATAIAAGGVGIAFPLASEKLKEQKQLAELLLAPKNWEKFYELSEDLGYNPGKRGENKFSIQLNGSVGYSDRGSFLNYVGRLCHLTKYPSDKVRLYVSDLRRNDPRKEEYKQEIMPLILGAEKELGAERLSRKYALCGVVHH